MRLLSKYISMAVLCGEPGSSFLLLAVRRLIFKKNRVPIQKKFFANSATTWSDSASRWCHAAVLAVHRLRKLTSATFATRRILPPIFPNFRTRWMFGVGWGGVWQCNEVRVHLRTPSSSIGRAVCRKLPTKTIFTFLKHDFQNTTFEVPDPRSNWKFKSTIAAFDGSSLRDLWCEAKNSCMFSV